MNKRALAISVLAVAIPLAIATSLPFVAGCGSDSGDANPPRNLSSNDDVVTRNGDKITKNTYSNGEVEYLRNGVQMPQSEGEKAYNEGVALRPVPNTAKAPADTSLPNAPAVPGIETPPPVITTPVTPPSTPHPTPVTPPAPSEPYHIPHYP